jgi:hypothetical protein
MIYEELWYHKGVPIGSQRRSRLNINKQQIGTIIIMRVGPAPDEAGAALNAAIRLFVDLQMMHQNISTLLVPLEYYDLMAAELAKYRFVRLGKTQENALEGQQLSIRLLSYPSGRDERYFFQK